VFKELKEWFTKELVLVAPDLNKKMRIEVDALDYTTGVSRSLKVDLIFISLLHFIFIFIFNLFSIFRTRVRVN